MAQPGSRGRTASEGRLPKGGRRQERWWRRGVEAEGGTQSHVLKLRGSCELSSICKMPSGWLKPRCPGKQGEYEGPWPGLEAATKAAPSLQVVGCHHAVISCEACSCRKASQLLSQSFEQRLLITFPCSPLLFCFAPLISLK